MAVQGNEAASKRRPVSLRGQGREEEHPRTEYEEPIVGLLARFERPLEQSPSLRSVPLQKGEDREVDVYGDRLVGAEVIPQLL